MRLGDASRMKVETISTGALTLDLALGGGYPKGRVVEVYGPESSGKTTLTLHAIAEVQKNGGVAAFVDAEHALDPVYAASLGVDVENLLVSQPDTGEMALEIVDQLIRSSAVDLVVVDSVAALTPRAEIEGEMGDHVIGSQARLMSQAMRKITGNIGKSGCTVIFLNQLRLKIGVTYGNPETTTGGNALKFYASVRLDIRRIQTLKRGTEEYGIRAKVKVAKNKVAPPFRIAEFDILFGKGISTTGCLLDLALGGGYPKGRVVEVYGPESSGKTTLTLHAIAEVQKNGGVAAFVDAEHALDPVYAASLGVDVENLLVSQPDTGEMALEIVDQLIRSSAVDLVVVDSVAALTPRAEIEGEMGDHVIGSQARLMSQAMRKITGNIGKSGCTVIFLNQLRLKIGVTYGNPETTTGGNALKFYASVRLDIRRIQTLKRGTEEYGIRAKVKVAKNKVAPPFRIAEFDILFGKGISTTGCLLDLAEETNIIIRRGAWYSYEGENIGQGRDNTIIWLDQNLEIRNKVESMVKEKLTEGTEVSSNSMKALNSNPANTIAVNDIKTVA